MKTRNLSNETVSGEGFAGGWRALAILAVAATVVSSAVLVLTKSIGPASGPGYWILVLGWAIAAAGLAQLWLVKQRHLEQQRHHADIRRQLTHDLERTANAERRASLTLAKEIQARQDLLLEISQQLEAPVVRLHRLAAELQAGSDRPPQSKLRDLLASASLAEQLLGGVLDVARLESGELSLVTSEFRLDDALGMVVELHGQRDPRQQVDLQLEKLGELPRGLRGDRERLVRSLSLVVGHLSRLVREGPMSLRVEQQAVSEEKVWLRFSVAGKVSGAAEKRPRLFPSQLPPEGGLLLTSGRRLVELMGGDMEIESGAAGLPAFWLTVPFVPGLAITEPQRADSEDATGDEQDLSGVLDSEILADLRRLGRRVGRDGLTELVEVFVNQNRPHVESMQRALARGNGKQLEQLAQLLRGSAASLGAVYLSQLCSELEELARKGDLENCAQRVRAVEGEFKEVEIELMRRTESHD